MNAKQLQQLKASLISQLDTVTRELETHADSAAVAGSEVEESIVHSNELLVGKINLALQRIEEGSYGRCSECDGEIAAEAKVKPNTLVRMARQIGFEGYDDFREPFREAIRSGGTTLQDFHDTDGNPGYFAQELLAYDREGQPCFRCQSAIKRKVIGQRSSYYCPSCQR